MLLNVESSFFMFGAEIDYYPLSANNSGMMKLNGNYLILEQAFLAEQELGKKNYVRRGIHQ
jgi:hypothetical protein